MIMTLSSLVLIQVRDAEHDNFARSLIRVGISSLRDGHIDFDCFPASL